jgi:hypothetical protein
LWSVGIAVSFPRPSLLLSSPALIAAVMSKGSWSLASPLACFLTLKVSFVKSVVDTDSSSDYIAESFRSIDPNQLVLNIVLKSVLKDRDIGVLIPIQVGYNLLEFGGVHAGRSGLL